MAYRIDVDQFDVPSEVIAWAQDWAARNDDGRPSVITVIYKAAS